MLFPAAFFWFLFPERSRIDRHTIRAIVPSCFIIAGWLTLTHVSCLLGWLCVLHNLAFCMPCWANRYRFSLLHRPQIQLFTLFVENNVELIWDSCLFCQSYEMTQGFSWKTASNDECLLATMFTVILWLVGLKIVTQDAMSKTCCLSVMLMAIFVHFDAPN